MAKKSKSKSPEVAMPREKSKTISIRKIVNGYIVRGSESTPNGYKEKETFVKNAPKLEMPKLK